MFLIFSEGVLKDLVFVGRNLGVSEKSQNNPKY